MTSKADRNRPETGGGGAFTLIELLVVISIIALLAALLLPAFNRAKSQASKTIDINNLKQMMVAIQLYTSDNHDTLPAPNWRSQDHLGLPGWLYATDPAGGNAGQFKPELGLLWPSLKEPRVYYCPAENSNSTLFAQRPQQLSSYAMNGAVVGYDRTNYPAVRLGQVRSEDIAFWETDETEPSYFNDGANFPSEGVSARHSNGAINAAFGGSVSYIRFGAWYVQVYETNKNNLWCYPESADGR